LFRGIDLAFENAFAAHRVAQQSAAIVERRRFRLDQPSDRAEPLGVQEMTN
jgi:hypothetical protein